MHFCPQSHKFFGRNEVAFVLKFSYDLCVDGAVHRVGFRIRTGAIVLEVSCHVVVQIVGLNFVAEASVCMNRSIALSLPY